MGLFAKLKNGLKKTKNTLAGGVVRVVNSFTRIDDDFFEELEETLILADLGAQTADDVCEKLRKEIKRTGATDTSEIVGMLRDILSEMLTGDNELLLRSEPREDGIPAVIIVIGVNGAGKTTTVGKLAANLKSEGNKVIVAAADTFRAAAIEQLAEWVDRANKYEVAVPEQVAEVAPEPVQTAEPVAVSEPVQAAVTESVPDAPVKKRGLFGLFRKDKSEKVITAEVAEDVQEAIPEVTQTESVSESVAISEPALEPTQPRTRDLHIDFVRHAEGADPAAVAYDACNAAKARKADVLIIDTAGRLHNKKHLMEELRKIARSVNSQLPGCSLETLLVLDATTGQNAVNQARLFGEVTDITGIALTKLDGTAKGGIIVSIKNELQIPVKLVGVGEKIDDLQSFIPDDYVKILFDTTDEVMEDESGHSDE